MSFSRKLKRKNIPQIVWDFLTEVSEHRNLILELLLINVLAGDEMGSEIGSVDPKAQLALAATLQLVGMLALKVVAPTALSCAKRACLEAAERCGPQIQGSLIDTPEKEDITAHYYRLLVSTFGFMLAPEIALTVAMSISDETESLSNVNYLISWGPAPIARIALGMLTARMTQPLFLSGNKAPLTDSWLMYPTIIFGTGALYTNTFVENYLPNLLNVINGLPIQRIPTPLLATKWITLMEIGFGLAATYLMWKQKTNAVNDQLEPTPNVDEEADEKAQLMHPPLQANTAAVLKKSHFRIFVAFAAYTVMVTFFNLVYHLFREDNPAKWDAIRAAAKGPAGPLILFGPICLLLIGGIITKRQYQIGDGPHSQPLSNTGLAPARNDSDYSPPISPRNSQKDDVSRSPWVSNNPNSLIGSNDKGHLSDGDIPKEEEKGNRNSFG